MNLFELTAASTYLSYWPDNLDYSALIKRLNSDELGEDDDAIDIWQPFEYHPGEFVAACIEALHQRLVKTFHVKE
jgi:hypothetical protein